MKVIICGSRYWNDSNYELICLAVSCLPEGSKVIHGAARGVDTLAGRAARQLRHDVQYFDAAWHVYGKAAGPRRNQRMLEQKPDLVIGFTDDIQASIGTRDMISRALNAGVPTMVMDRFGELKTPEIW